MCRSIWGWLGKRAITETVMDCTFFEETKPIVYRFVCVCGFGAAKTEAVIVFRLP